MMIRMYGAPIGAALLTLSTSTAAYAQLSPLVATITVPVSIRNMDAEWGKARFGTLSVTCDVSTSREILAHGTQPIPLVETPATTTVRAMLNFSGSVSVQTFVPTGASPRAGSTPPPGSAETAEQHAAANAIADARAYECYFSSNLGSSSGDRGKTKDLLSNGAPRPVGAQAADSSVFLVTGEFAKR